MKSMLSLPLLVGLGVTLAADPPVVDKASVKTFYRSFTRLTKVPMEVGQVLTILCVGGPAPSEIEAQAKRTGPHTRSLVHYYANDQATSSYNSQTYPFPVGSVIVKEKLAKDGTVIGVGGMRKRDNGFDPPHGNWEFFYTDSKTGFEIGTLKSCIDCHSTAKASDHVFTVTRVQRAPEKAKK